MAWQDEHIFLCFLRMLSAVVTRAILYQFAFPFQGRRQKSRGRISKEHFMNCRKTKQQCLHREKLIIHKVTDCNQVVKKAQSKDWFIF
ncbi:hypothetical protein AOXY_G35286 [Acipenser oxyrinchus oxyrinchus]|uniref:Uncharacterized protein n=1 Tax=Acipenser oxyrinchus oxyrinchus TaxID=40147 RepID=A0AAD8CGP1_ACIOX|nr:hypothetical protein AOXY_G35286 [Acipenser oxyrinchus oxyrinchus]